MKSVFVKDLHELGVGAAVSDQFKITDVTPDRKKNGDFYVRLTISDKTGQMPAKWWDCTEAEHPALLEIRYGHVQGTIASYKDKKELHVASPIQNLGELNDTSHFEIVAALPVAELKKRLKRHIASIRNADLSKLLTSVFADPAMRPFYDHPAAEIRHHACKHGLLQHTIEVADLAAAIADLQATWGYDVKVERDLAVTGALLHDIGKVWELDGDGKYTECGRLLGHVVMGFQFVDSKMADISDMPQLLKDAVLHIILSHHGRGEFGAPVLPVIAEAQIVHAVDMLDAELFYMNEAALESSSDGFVKAWKLDGRRVFARRENIVAETVALPYVASPASTPEHTTLQTVRFKTSSDASNTFKTRRLPLVGRVAAGPPILADPHIEAHYDVEDNLLPAGNDCFVLKVRGDSMLGDGIRDGDMIVVRQQKDHEPDDIVLACLRDDNEAAIKRVLTTDKGVFLMSSNPEFPPIPVPDPEALDVQGRVIARLEPEK